MKARTIPLPRFTAQAKNRWEQIPKEIREKILECVFCPRCRTGVPLQLREGEMVGLSLVLRGACKKCGSEAVRVIEPVEE